jgi:hypothetical protein
MDRRAISAAIGRCRREREVAEAPTSNLAAAASIRGRTGRPLLQYRQPLRGLAQLAQRVRLADPT